MTEITETPLEPGRLLSSISADGHGAQALFVGVVRDHHQGRGVCAVSYEAFRPLAEKVLSRIAGEADEKWGVRVAAAHRLGRLDVGEASLAVAVGSPHRAEAFEACRWVVEEIKARLPVWKKEHYADGKSAWLEGCALTAR